MTLTMLLAVTVASTLPAGNGAPVADAPLRDHGVAPTPTTAAPHPQRIPAAVRAQGGIGPGSYDAGAAAEYWFADSVGAGLNAAVFGTQLFGERDAYGAGLYLALRRFSTGSTPLLTLGGGVAYVDGPDPHLCLADDGCDTPPSRTKPSAYVGAGFGWLFRPTRPSGGVELGPVLRADLAEGVPAITLNLAVGYAGAR